MLKDLIVAVLLAFTLAVGPVAAQTPAPGPTPPTPQTGAAGPGGSGPAQTTPPGLGNTQGTVVGTPKDPSTTDAQRGASFVPLLYIGLIALGAGAAFWYVVRRRRGRG